MVAPYGGSVFGPPAISVAGCDKRLDGKTCDVMAIGRCGHCHDAFCATHQGRREDGLLYRDLCEECRSGRGRLASTFETAGRDAELAEEARARPYPERHDAARARFQRALAVLKGNGCPGLQQRWRPSAPYRVGFLRERERRDRIPIQPAWYVGDYEWVTFTKDPETGVQGSTSRVETYVLPSGDFVAEHGDPQFGGRCLLGAKSPTLEGAAAALERIALEHGLAMPPDAADTDPR